MLRFDVALQALRNKLKPVEKPSAARKGGVLIPFPGNKANASRDIPEAVRRKAR